MGVSFNAAAILNGSGINIQSVVTAILTPETSALTSLQNQQTDLSTQAGLLTGYNNNLASLQTAMNALSNLNGPLASLSATSSQPSMLTAVADSTAAPGVHQIVVTSLATAGTVYTDPLADGNTSILTGGATTGDIQLQIGGTSGVTQDIPITQGSNDTLTTLASYINAQGWGVSASVVNDANGARLAIYSQASGTAGALAITSNTSTSLNFKPPVGGANASLTIDGVPISSASNTISGAIAGVTINLTTAAPSTQIEVTVGPDATQAATAITAFVTAYNALIGNLNTQFTVDPTTNTEGPLGGDSALRALQSSLLADATYSVSGNSGLVNLASLGINLNGDGTLTIDNTQLNATFTASPAAFQSFFQNSSVTGFADNFSADLANHTNTTTGVLNLDIAQNKTAQLSLTDQTRTLHDRLTTQKAALTLQYAAVNATLQAYPSLLAEVTAEIGALGGNYNTVSASNNNTTPATGTATGG